MAKQPLTLEQMAIKKERENREKHFNQIESREKIQERLLKYHNQIGSFERKKYNNSFRGYWASFTREEV